MKLKKLLSEIPVNQVKGSRDVDITGICSNSKLVAPGNLFIAKKGKLEDGALYIPEAIAGGAVAVLTDIFNPSIKNITQIVHPNVSMIEALLAEHYYQFASQELFMVGITGTNGKTTTSFLIKHLLDQLKGPCGLIGTIEYIIGQQRYQATRTTPDVVSNHKMLREMVLHGCRSAVMEVTSHALDQGRVQHIDFDVAVFTNLTVDHLDYHKTMENYCSAKNKLFSTLINEKKQSKKAFPKIAVVNADSPWHKQIIQGCKASIITYGIDNAADLKATDIHMSGQGTQLNLNYQGHIVACKSPLVGRYNVYNTLAAIAVGLTQNIALENLAKMISTFSAVSGRLEPVQNPLGLKIYVDFAHSDDALTNVLECLSEIKQKRIITVFGCGGDRDKSKRPLMAKACEEFSDVSIVTSDNPRSEDPLAILQQVTQGFRRKESYTVIPDRYAAIEHAINIATPEDIVLIAGKGHEAYQIFSHKIIEFDDRKVALQICQNKKSK